MDGIREAVNYTSSINFYVFGAEDHSLMFVKDNANFYEKNSNILETKIIMTKKLYYYN